jgi:hypothetical protein
MGRDNVDRRLLVRFEASWEHERVRRELLPPVWISADLDDSGPLGELFEDVLGRARGHVRREREALAARTRLDHTVSPAPAPEQADHSHA